MKKKQLISKIPHTCKECANAYLMRSSPQNPIVAKCAILHTREVASTLFTCKHFKPRLGNMVIHPMIYCK